MTERDSIHRFLFEQFPIRGELVHLNASYRACLANHDYPLVVRDLLGEALAVSALLTSTLKFEGSLTLQLQGEGPLQMLVAQCTSEMNVRGLAHYDDSIDGTNFAAMTSGGRLAITIENHIDNKRYQGIVPIEGDRLAAGIETYFRTSEQIPTRLWLAADDATVVGMLLQQLPDESKPPSNVDDDAWPRVQMLAETITRDELLALSDKEILHRLFHEEDLRLYEAAPVSFRCTCSRQRISAALRGLGRAEIDDIVAEQGQVTISCDFCNRQYNYDPVDVEGLFAGPSADKGPSPTRH